MKVSIITAVLNGAGFIQSTIDSVAEQDYGDIEHIIVDGGSSDETLEIVSKQARGVTKVITGPDRGIYDGFNKGLRASTGSVIAYLNCGDQYTSSGVVSTALNRMNDAAVGATFGNLVMTDVAGRVVRRYSSARFRNGMMRFGFMPAHPTLFLRRSVYDDIGEYDESFRIAGDFELCVRAFAKRKVRYVYLPEDLVSMVNDGVSNRGWRSKWRITLEMRRACRMNNLHSSILLLLLRIPLKLVELR